jgi:aminoglycoside phosphotransferase (APT) family kinase protein
MQPDELEDLAARHIPGAGTIEIHRLGSGLINETYRALRDGSAYALRVAAANPYRLAVDRLWEAGVLERAAAADLAPELVYCDPQRGVLVTRWAAGRTWTAAEARLQSNVARMAGLARRIHALPVPLPARVIAPRQWIDSYCAAGGGEAAGALRPAAQARLAELAALPSAAPVVCHSDLHTLNLIDREPWPLLLDWEYAHVSDPLWDLAGWSANNDFDAALTLDLLRNYLGRAPSAGEHARLGVFCWLFDYVCLLWSELYLNLPGGSTGERGAQPKRRVAERDEISARSELLAARLRASK